MLETEDVSYPNICFTIFTLWLAVFNFIIGFIAWKDILKFMLVFIEYTPTVVGQ